jgi:hypothetical protein
MISGAMGDVDFYSSTSDIYADEFTVVFYKRRARQLLQHRVGGSQAGGN